MKHQWNKEKASKWERYQPILHPTDATFENRILYIDGDYLLADSEDVEAKNLINLLQLNDILLAKERKAYIKRKEEEMEKYNVNSTAFFELLIGDDITQISYLRAIDKKFNINIWKLLPEIE